MPTSDIAAGLISALVEVVEPVEDALTSVEAFEAFLLRLGWLPPENQAYFDEIRTILDLETELGNALAVVDDLRLNDGASLEDLAEALKVGIRITESLRELLTFSPPSSLPFPLNQSSFWSTFANDLIGDLFASYLQDVRPRLFAVLLVFGIIEEQSFPADLDNGRAAFVRLSVMWSRLPTLVSDPRQLMVEAYGWGGAFDHAKLLRNLQRAIQELGPPVDLKPAFDSALTSYFSETNPALDVIDQLTMPLFRELGADRANYAEVGLVVFPIPAAGDLGGDPIGVFLTPYIHGAASGDISLGRALVFRLSGGLEASGLVGIEMRPGNFGIKLAAPATALNAKAEIAMVPVEPLFLLGKANSDHIQLTDVSVSLEVVGSAASPEVIFALRTTKLEFSFDPGLGDGFIQGTVGSAPISATLSGGIVWSSKNGLRFDGQAGLTISRGVHETFGPFTLLGFSIRVVAGSDVRLELGVSGSATIGPITATVQDIGGRLLLQPAQSGQVKSFGDLDVDFGFKPPTGVGIAINAGPISGGGFLFIDEKAGRYAGACELSIYGVAVKAFGVIDTKFPDGRSGFSFVIVISAEFTPVQLGFGFTLLGVGGLIGINRTLDQEALRGAIRSHTLDHILFPHDVIANAPAIIHDLTAIFPASEGRYVFGPLAKFGWGTPTVIDAELGLILVLPGPLLALLGEVHSTLPNQKAALVKINIAIAGVLDFPQKRFSLDGSLHDSKAGQFTLSGDMAMRLSWGANASFALSVGGFNPGFKPPAGFPALARMAIDMGLGGNPSIRHEAYLAVTSNTLQVGARSQITAHGGGIDLQGHLGWDALFVLSPFSFKATFDAGVSVRFHGHGIGVHLHGEISGPSPWRVKGNVCVSLWFWDACLSFDKTFGGEPRIELPAIDPFLGSPPTAALIDQEVVGLKNALEDPRNWSSVAPAGSFTVVTLAQRKDGEDAPPPVDPLGAAVLHQRVVPLNRKITLYGGVKPLGPGQYNVESVTVSNGVTVSHSFVQDDFAPAVFKKMSDAEKLSNRSFEQMDAGVKLVSDDVKVGGIVPRGVTYDTIVVGGPPGSPPTTEPRPGPTFTLTDRHLAGMTARSATALLGMRVAGAERFVDPTAKPKVELPLERFVVAQRAALATAPNFLTTTTRSASTLALEAAVAANPALASQLHVIPFHELP